MLYVDLKTFLVNQNLAYSDRLSMAASVEMRVPFLDNEVADFALELPERAKLPRASRKGGCCARRFVVTFLRESNRRRKAGFGAPIRSWLQRDLFEIPRLLERELVEGDGYLRAQRGAAPARRA